MTGTTTDGTKTCRRGVSDRAGCAVTEHRGQILRPTESAIEPGSTITWTNNGALPHAVTTDDGSFDSGVLNPGDSYSVAFDGRNRNVLLRDTLRDEGQGRRWRRRGRYCSCRATL